MARFLLDLKNLTNKPKGGMMNLSGSNFVVIMKDPITGEKKNLTMPSSFGPTQNSCRRFKRIGMENIYVGVNEKKPRKRKKQKVDTVAFAPLPDNEEDWVNSLVKNLEVDKNEK